MVRFLAILPALALTACAGIDLGRPQAFPRDTMDATRIAAIAETVPLAILPPTGLAPADAAAVALALAGALATPERPAAAGRRSGPSDVLAGDVQIVTAPAGRVLVARWRLMPLRAAPRDLTVRIALAGKDAPGPRLWQALATETAAALSAPPAASAGSENPASPNAAAPAAPSASAPERRGPERPGPGSAPPAEVLPLPPVAVQDAEGAPGDGPSALSAAMRRELGRFGFPEAAAGAAGSFVVAPEVRVAPAGMTENIRIDWIVRDPRGVEVGRITQENAIPAGALVPRWGDVAMLAASAAALSVGELVAAASEQLAADAALRAGPPADR